MSDAKLPQPYTQWRSDPHRRAEDAAYVFGHDLIRFCRAEAIETLGAADAKASVPREQAEKAIDTSLHNVMDLLEGFFGPLSAGPHHKVEYVLSVVVRDQSGTEVERVEISPCKLDLPIGYWKWKDGEFQ